jgi:hypothetical protein
MKTETIETASGPARVRCYESAGEWDKWTVLFADEKSTVGNPNLRTCVGLSGTGAGLPGKHLGKRVPFASIPDQLKSRCTQ